jgi:hypothetical protein
VKDAARREDLRQTGAEHEGQDQQTAKEPRILWTNLPVFSGGEEGAICSHGKRLKQKNLNIRSRKDAAGVKPRSESAADQIYLLRFLS